MTLITNGFNLYLSNKFLYSYLIEEQNPEISSANTVTAVNEDCASNSSEEAIVTENQVETPIDDKEGLSQFV